MKVDKGSISKHKQIKISKATYDRLMKAGKPFIFGDTVDKLLNRVLDKLDNKQ